MEQIIILTYDEKDNEDVFKALGYFEDKVGNFVKIEYE